MFTNNILDIINDHKDEQYLIDICSPKDNNIIFMYLHLDCEIPYLAYNDELYLIDENTAKDINNGILTLFESEHGTDKKPILCSIELNKHPNSPIEITLTY